MHAPYRLGKQHLRTASEGFAILQKLSKNKHRKYVTGYKCMHLDCQFKVSYFALD